MSPDRSPRSDRSRAQKRSAGTGPRGRRTGAAGSAHPSPAGVAPTIRRWVSWCECEDENRQAAAEAKALLAVARAVRDLDHDGECPQANFDAAPDTCTCWRRTLDRLARVSARRNDR